jgi:hypothetical protein
LYGPITAGRFEDQPKGGQMLAEAIVKILGQPAPFVLLCNNKPA